MNSTAKIKRDNTLWFRGVIRCRQMSSDVIQQVLLRVSTEIFNIVLRHCGDAYLKHNTWLIDDFGTNMDCSNGYMFFCTIYIIAIQKPANSIKLISCQICLYSRTAKQRTITFILISMNNEIIVPETKRTKYEAVK